MTTSSLGDKKILLTRLLDGVKGCQSRFGSRTELATENEEIVRKLCTAFEDIFLHGVKKSSAHGTKGLWQMTENLVPSGLRPTETLSFWPLVKSQLSKHEAERFLLLHKVRTDLGRSRAWLRASLNEHSLERYILIVLSVDNLDLFYENTAFLRDPELSCILPQTAAGLGSVLFALSVDNPNLDKVERVMDKEVLEPIAASLPEIGLLANEINISGVVAAGPTVSSTPGDDNKPKKLRKKKKKVPTSVVSFDDLESGDSEIQVSANSSVPSTCVNSPTEKTIRDRESLLTQSHPSVTQTSVVPLVVSAPTDTSSVEKSNSKEMNTPTPNCSVGKLNSDSYSDDFPCNVQIINSRGRLLDRSPDIYSSSVKSADCLSIYSDCSDRLDNISISGVSPSERLKPVGTGYYTEGFVDSANHQTRTEEIFTQDLIPVPSFDSSVEQLVPPPNLHLQLDGADTDFAYLNITSPATPSCSSEPNSQSVSVPNVKTKDSASKKSSETNKFVSSYNNVHDSKIRLITSESGKSDNSHSSDTNVKAEERLIKLKAVLDHEVEVVATLKAQLAEERRNSNDEIKILEAKADALSKENEILKHQLKKYVGAVQLLKKEKNYLRRTGSFEEETDDTLLNSVGENEESSNEAAEYERKLIQVAEMHGELMEFNSHLQRSLQRKDQAIRRLREELVDLRGPLAAPLISTGEEEEDLETWDLVDSADNRNNTRRIGSFGLSNERVLINIWIPSAFLTGATNDLHHVYQVFVRIKDTEWNVYRRYSQFYSLHRDMKKKDSVIGSFYFPPKKHLGNKDAKFVDERRRKLQEYLRKVINYTLQTNAVLAAQPDKNLLISILPFFGEYNNSQSQKPKRERSRSRNLFFRQTNSTSQAQPGVQQQLHSTPYPQYTGL